ncbi:beta strand repeat-containing protein [Luteolibacter marinus]|uniref:beta strand repeat-containing protein n=1 Tax=Luteolibacter marinus TaxID=2776705 RepID=UPI001866B24C|nr:autotransporter-associated beta strand repeat-containing protein [Luteolibacter marinus]
MRITASHRPQSATQSRRRAPWGLLGLLLAAPSAHAATITWDAELNNGLWDGSQIVPSIRTNWSNQTVPGTADVARFDDASLIQTIRAIDLQGNQTVSSLAFKSATSGYTLDTAVSKYQLTLNSGAIGIEDGNHTIHSDVVLGANGVWSVNSGDSLAVNGVVSGSANLSKTGGGTLGLGGTNIYTGVTSISGGTLRLDADNVIPDTSVLVVGGTLNMNGHADSVLGLSGTGSVNLNGGDLTILDSCAFGGRVFVTGPGDSSIIVPGGVTYTHEIDGAPVTSDIASLTPSTVSLTFDVDGTANIEVPINTGQGTGNLIKTGTGTLSLLSDASGYQGSTVVENGMLVISSVTHAVSGNTSSIGNGATTNLLQIGDSSTSATLEFTGSTANGSTNRAIQLGDSGATIKVTQAAETLALSGVISDHQTSGALTKTGPGTLALSGASTYSGGTTVSDGTLAVTNASGSGTGSGQVVVATGGTLTGPGSIDGELVVTATGKISPGTSTGTLTVNNASEVHGIYDCEIDGATADRITASGALDLSGCIIEFDAVNPPTEPVYVLASGSSISNPHGSATAIPSGYVLTYVGNELLLMQPLPVYGGSSYPLSPDSDTQQTDLWDLSAIIPGSTSWTLLSNSNTGLVTPLIDPATGKVTLNFTSTLTNASATLVFRGSNAAGQYGDWTITITTRSPIYVDLAATGGNDGSSWTNAYTDLQSALSTAVTGDHIWVSRGRYLPGATRDSTFQLVNDVKTYGGFSGVEFHASQRDPVANPTILSGDVDNNDTGTDGIARTPAQIAGGNAYHVVTAGAGLLLNTVLDGFIVTAGQADGIGGPSQVSGGGFYAVSSRVLVANCRFMGNQALNQGGAIYLGGAANGPVMINCTVSGNTATEGGGIAVIGAYTSFVNCAIYGNLATISGGGVLLSSGGICGLYSCTVSGNHGQSSGGGITNNSSTLDTINTIVWGNQGAPPTALAEFGSTTHNASSSLLEGITLGGTNFDGATNPGFVSPVNPATLPTSEGDLRLTTGSPLIGLGDVNELRGDDADLDQDRYTAETHPRDLLLLPRVMGGVLEPGAYETRPVLYVDANVSGGTGDGSSWANAFPFLQDALDAATAAAGAEIRVAGGTYHPDDGASVTANDPAAVFRMANDVALYGGYAGGGMPAPDLRDPDTWPSILSGDLADDDGALPVGTNSSHVVAAETVDKTAILDGFTVTGGVNYLGSALVCFFDSAPRISNCRFTGNHATEAVNLSDPLFANQGSFPTADTGFYDGLGGCVVSIHNFGDALGSETYPPGLVGPLITDCVVSGNSAQIAAGYWAPLGIGLAVTTVDGCDISDNDATLAPEGGVGGIGLLLSNTNILRCRISGNAGGTGGVYVVENGPSVIANTLISGNTGWAGGILFESGEPLRLINCTVTGNNGTATGGIAAALNSADQLVLDNCLVWNNGLNGSVTAPGASLNLENSTNPTLNHTIIEGVLGGPFTAADFFVAPVAPATAPTTGGDYRLKAGSLVIDNGDSSLLSLPDGRFLGAATNASGALDLSGATDLFGAARLYGSDIDIGAYEWTALSVTGISPALAGPTNAGSLDFTVTFNQPVIGFDAFGDLTLVTTGTATATGATFSGSGHTYTVTLTGVSGDGTLALKVNTASDVTATDGHALASSPTSAAVAIDHTAPTVVSITPNVTSPTNATNIEFTITFSEVVTNVSGHDMIFELAIPSYQDAILTGSGDTYIVSVTGISGDGTITLGVRPTGTDVVDAAGNLLTTGHSGVTTTFDHTAPTVTTVFSDNVGPTKATDQLFAILFSEPVTGFDASDLSFVLTGDVNYTSTTLTGSGSSYSLVVDGISGTGTMALEVLTTGNDVADAAGNLLSSGATSAPSTIDNTGPSAISITPLSYSVFTVVFDEPVSGFNAFADLVLITTGDSRATHASISGSGDTYTVTLEGVSGEGTLALRVSTTSNVTDLATNPLASSVTSAAVEIGDIVRPFVLSIVPTTPNPVLGTSADYLVTFSEPVVNFNDSNDLLIQTLGTVSYTGVTFSGSGAQYTVTINGLTGDGILRMRTQVSDIEDLSGNSLDTRIPYGNQYEIGSPTGPRVVSITPATTGPVTSGTYVQFSVVFSEAVTGFDSNADMELSLSNIGRHNFHSFATTDGITHTFQATCYLQDGFTSGTLALGLTGIEGIQGLDGSPLLNGATSPTVNFTATPYQIWGIANGLTAGVDFEYGLDGDLDGLPNGVEFIRNLNPKVADANQTRQMFHLVEIGGQKYGVLTLACRTDAPYEVLADGWLRAQHYPISDIGSEDHIEASTDLQFGGAGKPAIIQDLTLPTPAGLPTLDSGYAWYHFRFVDPVSTLGRGFMQWHYEDND